jgi:nucleoside-diphosphate-sugar epimerase
MMGGCSKPERCPGDTFGEHPRASTINQLVDITESIARIKLKREHDLSAPKGVNGRNSDNSRIKKYLGWEPGTPLRAGMEKTYRWIYDQYMARERGEAGVVRESSLLS